MRFGLKMPPIGWALIAAYAALFVIYWFIL